MSVRFTSNTKRIIVDNEMNIPVALRFIAQDIKNISEPKTPKKLGDLRASTLISVLGKKATIVWNKEYAIYQEEKNFKHYTTPGTGSHFARNAVTQAYNKSEDYFRKARVIL